MSTSEPSRLLDQIADAVRQVLPGLGEDAQQHLRAALMSRLARLDLVTREEFEVQQAVLARTRALLERLEKQVAALENQTKNK
jgi:hypothetical protein